MPAALVFDFDGTILDTEGPVYQSWAELWADHGHELSLPEWQAIIGTEAGFDPWAELEARLGRRLDPALVASRRARRDELQADHDVRPGVVAWLDEARRLGVPVGIASSSPIEWVVGHLERIGLFDRFSCFACVSDDIPAKPDAASYRTACETLGADPRLSVAVEDSPHGIAAAVGAGLYTIAVPHPLTEALDLSAADLVVESLETITLTEALAAAARPR